MLSIILSWIYITVVAYPAGVCIHAAIAKMTGYKAAVEMHFSLKCLTGLMIITFISTLSCLIIPLGLTSNCLLLACVITGGVICRNDLRLSLHSDRVRLKDSNWFLAVPFIAIIIIIAYISYKPSSHYDDGLYYSTSIKWLQEYGTVKGLANLNLRIGFNSSWLILQANFGFQYLKIGLFNDMNGLIFLWIFLYSLGGLDDLLKGHVRFTSSLKALFMLPILAFHVTAASDIVLFNVNCMNSPSADVPACLLIWLIFLLFLEGERSEVESAGAADALILLYSVWVFTIKLSSLPVLLLSCFLLIRSIRRGYYRRSAALACAGLIFVIPWMIRSLLISGYLLFPVPSTSLFDMPWRYPTANTQWQAAAIRSYALSTDAYRSSDMPFSQWFPGWLASLKPIQHIVLAIASAAVISYLLAGAWILMRKGGAFFTLYKRRLVFIVICTTGILFWLLTAPDFRFGYGFLIFYCIVFLLLPLHYLMKSRMQLIAFPILLYIVLICSVYYSGVWISIKPFVGHPLPYRMPTDMYKAKTDGGGDIYLVRSEDSWNAPLPVSYEKDFKDIRPVYLGRTVKDGFRPTCESSKWDRPRQE